MCPGWSHLWHVVRGHAVQEWLAGLPALVQIAHIGPPPPLLLLPAPLPPPPGPAPAYSAASGRWGVVPGLETGGGGGAVCAPPPQPACGGGLYAGPPPQLDWWVGLYHGEVGAVCCHADTDWYEFFPPKARLSSCMARFFEAAAAGVCAALILCTNQSTVSLDWFWAMASLCPTIRLATTSRSPSTWEGLNARRSH